MTLFEDWKERYLNKTCTLEHLLRLQKLGKLSEEEVRHIIALERLKSKGLI